MFDFIRNHQRWALAILALFILPGLGLVGIQGFRGFFDDDANVASVNGHKISRQDYDSAVRDQLDRARQMLGASFDPKVFDTPKIRSEVLDQMIQQRIVADEAQRLNLTASNAAVLKYELSIPAIAQLRKPDGTMDLEQYRQLLQAQGMTPTQFDARVQYQIAEQQISENIATSAMASKTVAQQISLLAGQQREVQGLAFKSADYLAQVHPSDADLKTYYDAHAQAFQTPESAQIDYVTLDQTTLAAAYQPSDADQHKYYQDNLAHYRTDGEVRASHILIVAPKNGSAADLEKARQKATAILADVRAHPDKFADLAKQNSQDPGSAANGGDLGFFSHGMMVKPFEDAAFALKKGEVSDLVQSDFGFHIIKVTDVKPAVTKSFDDVKGSIVTDLRNQQAAKLFADSADGFTNAVYEAPANSLKPAADKYHLTIHQATVTRTPNPALAPTDPLNNPKLLAAVFADDAVKAQHNTAAIEIGPSTLISAHVTHYQAAAVPPLDTIKAQVQQKYVAEQAAKQARDAGAAQLAVLQKTPSTSGFSPMLKVSRTDAQGVPGNALQAIFKVDGQHLPQYVGIDLGDAGYAIYRVNAIDQSAAVDPSKLAAAQQQIAQIDAQSELTAYYASLKARSKIKYFGSLAATPDSPDNQ